jgi:hypothetical protein
MRSPKLYESYCTNYIESTSAKLLFEGVDFGFDNAVFKPFFDKTLRRVSCFAHFRLPFRAMMDVKLTSRGSLQWNNTSTTPT